MLRDDRTLVDSNIQRKGWGGHTHTQNTETITRSQPRKDTHARAHTHTHTHTHTFLTETNEKMIDSVIILFLLTTLSVVSGTSSEIQLVAHLKHPIEGIRTLETRFWDVATPNSGSRFGQFMSIQEISDMLGSKEEDLRKVQDWMIRMGASSTPTINSLRNEVTGTFSDVVVPSFTTLSATKPAAVDFVVRRDPLKTAVIDVTSSKRRTATVGDSYTIGNIKRAYGIPTDLRVDNDSPTIQMV